MGAVEQVLADAAYQYFPHRFCIALNPWLVWNEAITATLIFLSYMAMPLIYVRESVRRRWPYWWLAAGFIGACGLGHLFDIISLVSPNYYREAAIVDIVTVLFSVPAAYSLYKMIQRWERRDREQGIGP